MQEIWKDSKSTRVRVYHEIWRRLQSPNIDISCLHPSILPFLPTSHKHSDWWRRLLLEPLLVSGDQLKRLFKLTESVTNTSRPSLSRQTWYVRSYKLKVKPLRCIIAKWELQGRYYNESIVWVRMTDSLDPDDFVFIRYIGITRRFGIRRCFEDNKNRTFLLLPAFSRIWMISLNLVKCHAHVTNLLTTVWNMLIQQEQEFLRRNR